MRAGPTGTEADKFTFALNAGVLETQFVEHDSITNTYIASSIVQSGAAVDTSPYSWMLVGVSYNFSTSQTDIELTKDGTSIGTATEPQQFTDIMDPSHVKNIIGCQLDQSNAYGAINFFTGDIWEVFLVNSKLSGADISSGINTSLLPVLDTCTTRDLYYDTSSTSCVTCNETPDDTGAHITLDDDLCSPCNSALCTQCTGSASGLCTKCVPAANLINGDCTLHCDDALCTDCTGNAAICQVCTTRATLINGTCGCSANSADNGSGDCVCSSGYSEIVSGVCSECRYFLQAN